MSTCKILFYVFFISEIKNLQKKKKTANFVLFSCLKQNEKKSKQKHPTFKKEKKTICTKKKNNDVEQHYSFSISSVIVEFDVDGSFSPKSIV